eukprot:jgi/Psemu1/11412/gm1.11412_g
MSSPEPIKTLVFRAAQLHGTYFKYKYKDEDKDEDKRETLDVFQGLPDSSLGTNDNKARATKKLFPSLSKVMVTRSNKLNKGYLCLKWHSATKAQRAQHLVKKKIEEVDLLNTLDWLVAPVHHCLGCYNTNTRMTTTSVRIGFMGIYMQLITNHCPEWVDNNPTCAANFASMEFPIFAGDTEDMEASAAGPDIQLAQSWEIPNNQSHKLPCFAKSQEESLPPKGLEKILFQQSDAKMQESLDAADASWNSPPFDVNGSPPSSPATATADQLWSVEGAVATAEKRKRGTQLNPTTNWSTKVRWRLKNSID